MLCARNQFGIQMGSPRENDLGAVFYPSQKIYRDPGGVVHTYEPGYEPGMNHRTNGMNRGGMNRGMNR